MPLFLDIGLTHILHSPFWKVSEKFNGTSRKMRAAGRILDDFAYGIIDQREAEGLGNFSSGQKKEKATLDLLSLYMSIRDDAGKPLTRRALRYAATSHRFASLVSS